MWDEYAKSIGKTRNNLTLAEKRQAEFTGIMQETQFQVGDAAKLTQTYSGQVAKLTASFTSFKNSIGSGLINILTPIIKIINELMVKLVGLAEVFNQFTEKVFGKASAGVSETTSGIAGIGDAALGTAQDTAKAAKKISKSLLGIDQINKLNDNSETGSGSEASVPSISAVDTLSTNKGLTDTDNKLKKILGKFKLINEMGNAFKTGFLDGINGVDFGHILDGLKSIKTSLKDVFNGTKGSFSNMMVDWAGAIGRELGSYVKIGAGIADAIITGTSIYLMKNKKKLIKTVNTIFDNLGTYFEKAGSISVTIADLIYGFFTDGAMKRAVANCISILADLVLKPAELISKFLADSFTEIDTYLTNMSPLISTTLGNIASVFENVTSTISTVVSDTFETIGMTYDTYVRPALTNFREGFEKISSTVLESWNTYIYPVIQDLIAEFNRVYDVALKPLIDQIVKLVGKIILLASEIYNRFVAPLISWFVSKLYPNIASTIKLIGNVIGTLVELVAGVAAGVIKSLGGIIDFLTGVFTGDWKKAWTGLKDIVAGIFDVLTSVLKAPINFLIDGLNTLISALNKISIDLPEWAGGASFGVNIDEIPKLAQGGYVKPNTPQLAMIGDNRHQGEVVAPENKLTEIFAEQLQPILTAINSLVTALANNNSGDSGDIIIPVSIGGTTIDNIIVTAQQRQKMRSGGR
jgi:phage-related protein